MRSYVPGYELQEPRTLADALERMAREPGEWKPFAGGTDLMVLLEAGKLSQRKFLSIWKLPELRGITVTPTQMTLNAMTTYSEIRRHELLAREFPLLCRAAAETGSIATQNRGTLGGNVANASPAADSPPALLVYDAELELVSMRGARWVPYHGFWKGYKQIDLRDDELIRAIRLPRNGGFSKHFYRKVGTRRAQAISKVCLAGAAQMDAGRVVKTLQAQSCTLRKKPWPAKSRPLTIFAPPRATAFVWPKICSPNSARALRVSRACQFIPTFRADRATSRS
jgi:CO/xanthine dehydrogenase FAD-binding subunit